MLVGNVDISYYVVVISGDEKGNTVIRLSKLARGRDTGDKQDREEATS